MASTVPTERAIWPGNAKWEIDDAGKLSTCSLKKLALSFIAENIGSVCNIICEDPRTICYAEPFTGAYSVDNVHKHKEDCSGGAGKSTCDKEDLKVFSRTSSHSSFSESTVGNVSNDGIKVNGTSMLGEDYITRSQTQDQCLVPYTIFNVPNYGKVYDKSNSTKPPSENCKRVDLLERDFFHFQWRQPDVYLSPHTVAMLLEELDRCGILNDSVLSLFHTPRMQLYEVRIHRCGAHISARGLKFLVHNKLRRLELHGMEIHSRLVSNCLNPWTKANLTALSLVSYSPSNRLSNIYKLIHKLPNLQELDLSYNRHLDPETLEILLMKLPNLYKLNISHCIQVNTIEPLRVVSEQLLHLSLAGVMINNTAITISVLKTLTRLRFLDVSTVATTHDVRHEECINEVLINPRFAPDLEYIDVSNQLEVSEQVLLDFLSSHPRVKCVALVNVPLCADFSTCRWPHIKFLRDVGGGGSTGGDLWERLTECMEHYRRWPHLACQVLTLVNAAPASSSPQPRLVASILQCMEDFQNIPNIQTSGSACLYSLTVGQLGPALHPSLLRSVVHATIHAMTLYYNNHQLQKHALLLLCCDSVLHHVSFNQYWVAMMALRALHSYGDDSVDLMAVGICSILAAKLTNEQTAHLGSNPAYMSKLLALVRGRVDDENADITLQFTLSALWNLTDESPVTCKIFLLQDGLQLFINLLLTFPHNTAVETKVLGLFNNVAEVPELRPDLLKPPFIAMLRRQLQSEHIAVSYFAAGISAHLVCAEQSAWQAGDDLPYSEVLSELGDAVLGWESPIEEMVAYKSFQPFLPLLHATESPYVQLWALWALHHVTSNNSKYYCPMLIREGIPKLLQNLRDDVSSTAPFLTDLSAKLLTLVDSYDKSDSKNQAADCGGPAYVPRPKK
ncbi:Armadillo-type fold [Trinorchestia longiramus]|nr:Armadillo-type fold [Trinorchestia longiramus]